MNTSNPPSHESTQMHIRAIRQRIPTLSNRQLEALWRNLIDLLTDISIEQAARNPDYPLN